MRTREQIREAAQRVADILLERDDIGKLPLPTAAKRYARRKGLAAMKRQPAEFKRVNAMLMNPGKPDKWKNYDVGSSTAGAKGKVPHSMK